MSIVTLDMHIRDERTLDFIKQQAVDGELKISADTIAIVAKCHANTARAILLRLRRAGYIEVKQRAYRGGYVYKVTCGETA